ncbi:unnamed protein product, partial [Amoebophrya sp. A120]|eukprot:GSA120T00026413001.1
MLSSCFTSDEAVSLFGMHSPYNHHHLQQKNRTNKHKLSQAPTTPRPLTFCTSLSGNCQSACSGSFDSWNRLFHSMETTYRATQDGSAVLMELLPEFFVLPTSNKDAQTTFLENYLNISTQEGDLRNVSLPPWSNGKYDPLKRYNLKRYNRIWVLYCMMSMTDSDSIP